MPEIDMRRFAQGAGVNMAFPAGNVIFNKGDTGDCLYVLQSGSVEIVVRDKVVEICGPNWRSASCP